WSEVALAGDPEAGDVFGSALAAADLGKTTHADLVIGVPGEFGSSGAVLAVYGTSTGLAATGNQLLTQNDLAVGTDFSEFGDRFGAALSARDFGRPATADVAVGAPGED